MSRLQRLFVLLVLLPLSAFAQINPDDLLPPGEAFRVTAEVVNPETVRFTWRIADGYYLYQSKIKVESSSPGVGVMDVELPPGKVKKDDFFGEVETYRGLVSIDVNLKRENAAAEAVEFIAKSQGCADLGVCYPPQAEKRGVKLPAASVAAAPPPAAAGTADQATDKPVAGLGQNTASSLSGLFAAPALPGLSGAAAADEEFMDPDKAFVFSASLKDANTLVANWNIADGYYLYRHRFKFDLVDADGVTLGEAQIPAGEVKEDEFFGTVETYHHSVEIPVPLSQPLAEGEELTLKVGYQGCAEAGLCYPPQKKTVPLQLGAIPAAAGPGSAALGSAELAGSATNAAANTDANAGAGGSQAASVVSSAAAKSAPVNGINTAPISESDSIAATLAGKNKFLVLLGFFGFGLLLTFTPCVFPMIPILSSIIVGQGTTISTRRAFTMSLVYVLAMALTYTVAGVIAGLAGGNLQAAFQNPWVLGSFAGLFVLLSLSMFGFYELQLPSSLQSKLTEVSNSQQGGTLIGVAIMGLLSALIVGPCVAPPLMGALIYIGQTGDAVLGGAALFFMSLGMGVPLLIIGTLGGKWLPRAGGWMDSVKAVFGVMLLAVAVWMLERIIPGPVALALWATLLLVSSVYMGAFDALNAEASGWRRLNKGLAVVLALYGGMLLIGAATGGDDMFRPLRTFNAGGGQMGGQAVAAAHVEFRQVKGVDGLQAALDEAGRQGKPVMLDFYADWCVECKRMERYTFEDAGVMAAFDGVVLLQADVTDNDDADAALLKQFSLLGPPAILFFDPSGQELRGWRFVGFKDAAAFIEHINGAFAGHRG